MLASKREALARQEQLVAARRASVAASPRGSGGAMVHVTPEALRARELGARHSWLRVGTPVWLPLGARDEERRDRSALGEADDAAEVGRLAPALAARGVALIEEATA